MYIIILYISGSMLRGRGSGRNYNFPSHLLA
jgi:hypothetical protein